jgi:DNA-binding MarR family transcriptional regulator
LSEVPTRKYNLTILLAMAYRALKDELHNRLAQTGFEDVRSAHGYIFQLISWKPAGINEIAEHLDVTKQAASQMIEYLEQHGYVKRERHPTDGRGKLVVLTKRGWDCIRTTESILSELEIYYTNLIGTERMDDLQTDLRSIILEANKGTLPGLLRPA